jgi:hypothetical protein
MVKEKDYCEGSSLLNVFKLILLRAQVNKHQDQNQNLKV